MSEMPTTPAGDHHGMSGMASTFSINTKVTLLFADWVTKTPAQYAFTLIFLFVLGLFNRFLAAFRSQLERKWNEDSDAERHWSLHNTTARRLHTSYSVRQDNATEELEPLSPAPPGVNLDATEKPSPHRRKGFWVAYSAWSGKRDAVRAAFEFIRAIIGYVL